MARLIVGNWKMHGSVAAAGPLARAIVAASTGVPATLVLCPPAVLIGVVAEAVRGSAVEVGAQDCHARPEGPHTGDLAAAMLAEARARWVIVGHSERRAAHAETDAVVAGKAAAAIGAGLRPIVCVGETLAVREAGRAEATVAGQLAASLPGGFAAAGGVVAYEPVWAIGTGRTPTGGEIAAMHATLREVVGGAVPLLYGGSVRPGNAGAILALPGVDGALVGGASLIASDFLAIAGA